MNEIGILERLPLRDVWKHEAYDFSKWLEENLEILSEAIDLTFESATREQAAGSFSVDLVAEVEGGGTAVIENQLGKSDHDHLGKLVTYVTAMEAKAAIWIVSKPRSEHVAAVSWLNESSSTSFYMVKVEAVRINDSQPAPLFTLIVGPSEEAREAGIVKKELAERDILRKRWWSSLLERSAPLTKLHAHLNPPNRAAISTSSGVRGLSLGYVVFQHEWAVELYIDLGKDQDAENTRIYDEFHTNKVAIEESFEASLTWQRLESKRACRIRYTARNDGGYRNSEDEWEEIQLRSIDAMIRLEKTLMPYIKGLRGLD